MIDIKDINGNVIQSVSLNSGSKRKRTLMKEDYVSLKFSLENPIAFNLGDGIDNELGKFELVDFYKPTYNKTTGGYDYELRLDAYYYKWKNKIFKYTPQHAGQEAAWSLTDDLSTHLFLFTSNLASLGYTYNGTPFQYSIDSSVNDVSKLVSYNNTNMIDALTMMAEAWDCEWWVEDNIIHFGRCEYGTPVAFEIGDNVEEMTSSASKTTYATRIYAFGSTRNIPDNYRPSENNLLNNGVVQRRLMLPIESPCVDAEYNMSMEEAVECVVVFDDIYPKTTGTMSSVTLYTQKEEEKDEGDTEEGGDNEGENEEGGTTEGENEGNTEEGGTTEDTDNPNDEDKNEDAVKSVYRFKDETIKFSEKYILEGEELRIIFQSGPLNGMEFGVAFNPNNEPELTEDGEPNPDAQLWEIVANDDYGRFLPDAFLYPSDGDTYHLIGWDSTKIAELGLIEEAENKLLDRAKEYVEKSKIDPNTYNCKMMSDYMYGLDGEGNIDSNYAKYFDIGDSVLLVNWAFFLNGSRSSRIVGYEYDIDMPYASPIYYVGERASYSKIGALESKLEQLTINGITYDKVNGGGNVYVIGTNDSTKPSNRNVFSALRSLQTFHRKDASDSTKYLQKFLGGIHVGEFLTGAKGIGMYKDANGNWHIETDYIDVRLKLTAKEIEIQHVSHIGGMLMNTPANMIVSRVEETDSSYICYMNTEDDEGNVIENMWAVGDQAYCETFNLIQQADGKLGNHFLWRLVTSVGEDYIELSKLDCAIGSDAPLAGDNLVVLGNRSNIERQGAIVLASAGSGSPYIRVYKDIIGYSLPMPHIELSPHNSIISATKIILESSGSSLDEEMQGMNDAINSLSRDLSGNFLVWQAENDDIPTLNNEPAVNWENDTERFSHVGDFYITTSGWVYQFDYDSDSNTYYWKVVTDKYLIKVAKDVEERSRTFVEAPTIDDVYDIGDTWVNATYPEDGSIYNDDTLVCIKAKDKGEPFDISHWRKDSKYTDDTKATLLEQEMSEFIEGYESTISDIQGQIDGKAETWYQENDPSADWNTSELKAMHKGDLWYNEETGETFYWNGSTWEQQNIPKDLFDRFDGKATIYVSKPTNGYMRNDMWILEKDYTLNGEDLKKGTIVFTDTTSETFVETHWGKYDRYTDDTKAEEVEKELNDFVTSYEEAIADIRKQIDGKAETWYQESDPSTAWDTDELKAKHVGDLWYNTTEEKTYYWDGSKWEAQDIPQEVFDDIDGKSSIYVSQPKFYKKNDIWVLDADYTLAFGIKYKKGTIVFALEDSPANGTETLVPDHWGKKDIYTDDEVVDDLKDKLFKMGIKFEDGQIVVTTDSFLVQDTNGTEIAIFNIDSEGNPTINGDYLNVNHINIADGAIVFEKDGSGKLANGAISWDSEGTFLNHINIESGTIAKFNIDTFMFGETEYGLLESSGNASIRFTFSTDSFIRFNDPTDDVMINARNDNGSVARFYAFGDNTKALELIGAVALNASGRSVLSSSYGNGMSNFIGGLSISAYNPNTDLIYSNNSFDRGGKWVDFIVSKDDITLPPAVDNPGKVLFIKANGKIFGSATKGGIIKAADAHNGTAYVSSERNNNAMIYISDGTNWYEFYCG